MLKYEFGLYKFKELTFGLENECIEAVQSIAMKKPFNYDRYEVYCFGQTMDAKDFILKNQNKGAYDKKYKEVTTGLYENLNRYDLFYNAETLRKSNLSYIIINGKCDDFNYEYEKALKVASEIMASFGREINIVLYNGIAYGLGHKFLEIDNRGFKDGFKRAMAEKYTHRSAKSPANGLEKSKALQNKIISGIEV